MIQDKRTMSYTTNFETEHYILPLKKTYNLRYLNKILEGRRGDLRMSEVRLVNYVYKKNTAGRLKVYIRGLWSGDIQSENILGGEEHGNMKYKGLEVRT